MNTLNAETKTHSGQSLLTDGLGVSQDPFGFYDHFNDVLYRGPLAWVEADKARMGGNQITALFDLSSSECVLAKRVAEIDGLTALLTEARLAVLREYGRNKREGGPEEQMWSDLLNRMPKTPNG